MLKVAGHPRGPWELDKLDLRLLKALLADNGIPPGSPVVRKSFRSMAKDLRVDQATIRSRMKKFQEQGILRGWYLGVSPALTGHSVVHAWLEVEPDCDKDGLIKELVTIRGVERVCNYLGPRVSLVLLYREERDLDHSLRRISKLAHPSKLFHAQGAPSVPFPGLTETDTAIIGNLQQDPWKPYPAAARELRLSTRTIKRRVTRLSEAGAIYMLPIISLKSLRGVIPVELVVTYVSGGTKAKLNERIVSRIRDELMFPLISGSHGYFALLVPNASMVEGIERWVKQLDGVNDVHCNVLLDIVLNSGHYKSQDSLVDRQSVEVPSRGTSTNAR